MICAARACDDARTQASDGDATPPEDPVPEPEPEPETDPDAYRFAIHPPDDAPVEWITISRTLEGAEQLIQSCVEDGCWIHGPGYIESIERAVRFGPDTMYRGAQEPPAYPSAADYQRLRRAIDTATATERMRFQVAVQAVQALAGAYAGRALARSRNQIVTDTVRYIAEAPHPQAAVTWLRQPSNGPAAVTFEFNQEHGMGLVLALMRISTAQDALDRSQDTLSRTMRAAGPEKQAINARRAAFLYNADPAHARLGNRYIPAYRQQLMDADLEANQGLARKAAELFPEPESVTRAYAASLDASAALVDTITTVGEAHPLAYRTFGLTLGNALRQRMTATDVRTVDMKHVFGPEPRLRRAVSTALRDAYAATVAMEQAMQHDATLVWHYPLLIQAAIDENRLARSAYERTAAFHRLAALDAERSALQRALARTSEVLMAAELAAMTIPAPQISVPSRIALGAIDTAVNGIGLLADYLRESEVRLGFRAFLNPSESFAASDGSYLGVIVGAAFLVFGTYGLSRTIQPLTAGAAAFTGVVIAGQEYMIHRDAQP